MPQSYRSVYVSFRILLSSVIFSFSSPIRSCLTPHQFARFQYSFSSCRNRLACTYSSIVVLQIYHKLLAFTTFLGSRKGSRLSYLNPYIPCQIMHIRNDMQYIFIWPIPLRSRVRMTNMNVSVNETDRQQHWRAWEFTEYTRIWVILGIPTGGSWAEVKKRLQNY